jgi:ketosteroid isomerase-like protein
MEESMKKLFAILFALIFTTSLVYSQDTSELMKKIQVMNDESAKRMLSGDESSMWDMYTDNVISMPSYEPMLKGLDACKESYKKMKESGMKFTAFKSTVTDVMQSGKFVIDIGTYETTMTMPQMGDMPYTDNGKYVTVWEMQDDGSMKVLVETWNTDTNPWEEMQKMMPPPPPPAPEGHEGHQH